VRTQDKIIRLRKGSSGRLGPGHPWVYARQILGASADAKPGDIVSVVDEQLKFTGRGYYNPKSDIAVRLLTFKDEVIDAPFFHRRIQHAVEKRSPILATTDAYRAVFSEADGLPGLVADVYKDTLVFQILTLGMEKLRQTLMQGLKDVIRPRYIYEKSESAFRKVEGLNDEKRWWGDKGNGIIEIFEGKAKFIVDIEKGHKTGFYLDQRRSRIGVGQIAKGKRVLDLFCYTGGFAIHATLGGAQEVHGVDVKDEWLELGRKNAKLNGVSDRVEFIKGDAFSALRDYHKKGEKFDIVIVDPPSFLKTKRELGGAIRGYKELNLTAMKILNDGGILCTFSCSHHMPNEVFADIIKSSAHDAKKRFSVLKRCHQAQDHPIVRAIPETEYLKGYFLRVSAVI